MKVRTLDPNAGSTQSRQTGADRLSVPLPLPSFSNKPRELASSTPSAQDSPMTTVDAPTSPASGQHSSNLVSIRVDLIDPHPTPPRFVYADEIILERAESLRSQGQMNPIHVMPNPDAPGRFIIIDGWTRVQACTKYSALTELRAEVHTDLSLDDAAWFGWKSNEGREQHCDYDRAMFFEALLRQGVTYNQIIEKTGINKTSLTMYRAFAKLPGEVIDFVAESPRKFGCRSAYELQKVFDSTKSTQKTLSLAVKFITENKTVGWLMTQAQAMVTPSKVKTTPSNKKLLRFSNGVYKRSDDEVSLRLKLPSDKIESFTQAIEKLLDDVAEHSPPQTSDDDSSASNDAIKVGSDAPEVISTGGPESPPL